MILSKATSPSSIGSYGENDYFAFVESLELLDPESVTNPGMFPEEWNTILKIRESSGLELPSAALWLDCVRADYFDSLEWRDDECLIGNKEHAMQRREHLKELYTSQFVVVLLLIDAEGKFERDELGRFNEMPWHVIQLHPNIGLPVLTVPDFDLDADIQKMCYLRHERFLVNSEYKSLSNVFSLNFLPDADLNGRYSEHNSSPTPPYNDPGDLPPKKKYRKIFVYKQKNY